MLVRIDHDGHGTNQVTNNIGWPFLRHFTLVCFFSGDPDSVAGEFGRHSLYKMLGYFSLVGLLRLHSLLGDYYQALKVLENIDFSKIVSFYTFKINLDMCFGN